MDIPRGREVSDDRGVVIVETALVIPIVLVLMLAIVEAGMLLFASLSVDQAVGAAARRGTIERDHVDADEEILDVVADNLDRSGTDGVQRVIIYRATDHTTEPPAACLTGGSSSAADRCSVYDASDLTADSADLDCGWCPSDREAGDLLGVWVEYRHHSLSGLFPDRTIRESMVLEIEPDV